VPPILARRGSGTRRAEQIDSSSTSLSKRALANHNLARQSARLARSVSTTKTAVKNADGNSAGGSAHDWRWSQRAVARKDNHGGPARRVGFEQWRCRSHAQRHIQRGGQATSNDVTPAFPSSVGKRVTETLSRDLPATRAELPAVRFCRLHGRNVVRNTKICRTRPYTRTARIVSASMAWASAPPKPLPGSEAAEALLRLT